MFTLCLATRAKGATSEPAFDAAEIRTTTELTVSDYFNFGTLNLHRTYKTNLKARGS